MVATEQSTLPETDGRRARGNRTRERILRAAIELFGSRGFESTSMKDLASAAGVQAPAIYNHFASKEDVLVAASTWAMQDFHDKVVDPDDPQLPTLERLEGLVRRHVQYQLDNFQVARSHDLLLDADAVQHLLPSEARISARNMMRSHLDLMTHLVDDASTDKSLPARTQALALLTMIDRVPIWYRPSGSDTKDEIADHYWVLAQRLTAV